MTRVLDLLDLLGIGGIGDTPSRPSKLAWGTVGWRCPRDGAAPTGV